MVTDQTLHRVPYLPLLDPGPPELTDGLRTFAIRRFRIGQRSVKCGTVSEMSRVVSLRLASGADQVVRASV